MTDLNINFNNGSKVDTQLKTSQNIIKPEIKKEENDKTNKKLLLSLSGLAAIATAGLLVRQGRIRKQNTEQIKNLFESINSTKNNINENIIRIQNNFADAGGRPVHDNWATLGQNMAMDNIESLMRHINGSFDGLVEKYNKLIALITDPVRKKEIQVELAIEGVEEEI